jgi:4,5-dihydroxyphthalate decarboxylase
MNAEEFAMTDFKLTAAFGDYDRTRFLDSSIYPEGVDLSVLRLEPSDIFERMCNAQEFDVAEMSMGAHCYLLGQGDSPFVGMPAFTSRAFRHSMVYYNTGSGIEKPQDLNGKRIAIREWGMTALVWIVGILQEEYGLDLRSIRWVAAKKPRVPIQMPAGAHIQYMTPGQNLSDMLSSGEVDAALIHQPPKCFAEGCANVKRMFPDYGDVEIDYYRRTGIHPIMHCVVLRRDWYEKAPGLLRGLYESLLKAREKTLAALSNTQAYFAMIPLLPAVMDETTRVFGKDFWPYGVAANRRTLEKLVSYAFQQGLTPRPLSIEELFDESVLDR